MIDTYPKDDIHFQSCNNYNEKRAFRFEMSAIIQLVGGRFAPGSPNGTAVSVPSLETASGICFYNIRLLPLLRFSANLTLSFELLW